jgi:predicted RNA-binding Zn-ribbon protein involved in translation (DUF1610 family)
MEESKKKTVQIVVIIVCFSLAGLIVFRSCGGRGNPIHKGIRADEMQWVKCSAANCEHEYEMNRREYYQYLEDHVDPSFQVVPPLPCPKCGMESVYKAAKCEKCGLVFQTEWKRGDFSDRCPNADCGYSKIQEDRLKAQAEREKNKGK